MQVKISVVQAGKPALYLKTGETPVLRIDLQWDAPLVISH
jgi:hypothetical protein